jgi:hypothetical protein
MASSLLPEHRSPSSTSSTRREALAAADTRERMAKDGTDPLPSTPEEDAAETDREEKKRSEIVRRSSAKAN